MGRRIMTIALGIVIGWVLIQLIRFLIYAYWGLEYWDWQWDLWWSNEIHRIYDYFLYR